MAAKRRTTTKKKTTKKARKKTGVGGVALVVRVSAEALAYIDQRKGERPRTKYVREIMAKGDARLGKLLGVE